MKITISTLSLLWMVQLAMVAASPVLTPLDNQDVPSTQKNQPQAPPMVRTTSPPRDSLCRVPSETLLTIVEHSDLATLPVFLEISRGINQVVRTSISYRNKMMKLRLPTVSNYGQEYDDLGQSEKDYLIDLFKFEFSLDRYSFGDPTDVTLEEIAKKYREQPLPEIAQAIAAYVKAELVAETRWRMVEFLALTPDQMYAMSPMLGLVADGNIDLVLELQRRLASYCTSAPFMAAFNEVWAPETHHLFIEAEKAYGIQKGFECTTHGFGVVQLATLFTLASLKKWESLVEFLVKTLDTSGVIDWSLTTLGFMLLFENGANPLDYDHYQNLPLEPTFVRHVQLCSEEFKFTRTHSEAAIQWDDIQQDFPETRQLNSQIKECPFDFLGNKIRYDIANNAVAFVVDEDIMKGVLGNRPFIASGDGVLAKSIPEVLTRSYNARDMQFALDLVEMTREVEQIQIARNLD
ncbi:hypothetical protein BJ085DRAFT_36855 [Dimargaris cristalligena]|uniref:F-box domain-containing protein n=1 Tax=Dimargaris cristalligena TaxID=215637 RepID=A0A4P9ZPY5_9FUNG|nr:hypothetical protein BJ085DRAFT_36855 [Dimargaris cristalligena]|eukprot:RKP34672.1 hypothetical protein BJ085DRAFT_36855 [Dimargaris cristalligena]